MNAKAKKIIDIVVNVLLWIFLIFAVLMTVFAFTAQANSAGFPQLGKKCFLTVLTDSMDVEGGFKSGDMIIGRVLTAEEKKTLSVNDVITFYTDLTPDDGVDNKELNTHRIVEIDKDDLGFVRYHTKGDNVGTRDPSPVYPEDVQAIWTGKRIPVVGSVVGFIQGRVGFLICIVLPMLLFFGYAIYVLVSTVLKIKNAGKRQITAEDEELIKQQAIEEYIRKMKSDATIAAQPATDNAQTDADKDSGKDQAE